VNEILQVSQLEAVRRGGGGGLGRPAAGAAARQQAAWPAQQGEGMLGAAPAAVGSPPAQLGACGECGQQAMGWADAERGSGWYRQTRAVLSLSTVTHRDLLYKTDRG
jgi:hypothetical protein